MPDRGSWCLRRGFCPFSVGQCPWKLGRLVIAPSEETWEYLLVATSSIWSSFRNLKGKNQFTKTESEAQCDHGTSLIQEEKTPL